ncbi:probable cysteine--tRNA ligase, mitochondrial isoform X3 [Sarcophilus harrisii]|uniref:probable cysteine--tRNA ligase, mitochondrial isoform X3 n=1 Tax=Sarcophilus harrisii TaxID=9305 RepID=UPI001301EC4B|nr:probable cysteine--tRNA ligase, mitochondrial isoform X3 [Sarcophilus harrisii]
MSGEQGPLDSGLLVSPVRALPAGAALGVRPWAGRRQKAAPGGGLREEAAGFLASSTPRLPSGAGGRSSTNLPHSSYPNPGRSMRGFMSQPRRPILSPTLWRPRSAGRCRGLPDLAALIGWRLAGWPSLGRGVCVGREKEWQPPPGHDTGIQIYNSLTRRKDPLILPRPEAISWYSCGPTVYDHAHLGHACSYVQFDIIRRILIKTFGYNIVMVMGITDVDDKIIKRATEMNISPSALARFYEEDFKLDMATLKVLPPTVYMRVTDNIPHIISFIERIISKGHAYSTGKGNVYFDLKSRGDSYGKLIGIVPEGRVEPDDSDKQYASDFALWKAAKPQEISWASPWGNGRPGWHIECSTISSLVFGSQLDIHTGGIDLAFPHHENEIAQCEVYHHCKQWGNYFLHSAIEYSDDIMHEAKHLLLGIASFVDDANAYMKGQLVCDPIREDLLWERLTSTKDAIKAAFADDFDTPRAVDAIMDLIRHGNRQLKAVTKEVNCPRSPAVYGAIVSYIENFLDTVGISLSSRQFISENRSSATLHSVVDELVQFRSKVRQYSLVASEGTGTVPADLSKEAKKLQREKRQQLLLEREPLLHACDSLRQNLAAYGINIKDRNNISTWELLEPGTEEQKTGK